MHTLDFVTLSVSEFVSGAEFGSYAFVHPVLPRLLKGPDTRRASVP